MTNWRGEAHADDMTFQTIVRSIPVNSSTGTCPTRRCTALAVALAAATVFAAAGCSSPPAAATPTTDPTAPIVDQAALQTELDDLVALGVPGAVLLVRDDDRSVVLTSGVSDLEAGTA